MRDEVPRSVHGDWAPERGRKDPLSILQQQELGRVPELVPIRHGRMAASPFAFFRGAAAIMASDLAIEPRTGLEVQLCGDAHLANFGGFAAPDRDLVFDVNDFDETSRGPFEWDLKRLAASFEIAGRDRDMRSRQRRAAVGWAVRSYREAAHEFAGMRVLDIWYSRLDELDIERRWGKEAGRSARRRLRRVGLAAKSKDNLRAFRKLVRDNDGQIRFVSDPPLLVPVEELFAPDEAGRIRSTIAESLGRYRDTLTDDRRRLFDRYRYVDLARKVVGVGSVGTRCWVALMLGQDEGDPLFLQVKEAEASVLEPYLGANPYPSHGQRVVAGQLLMQASSDIMLGWDRVELEGVTHDYYVRQLWDWKVSADIATMAPLDLRVYAQICGWTLARAHARSGDATAIAAYLGTSDAFDDALTRFATAYADQNELDHRLLCKAIAEGRMASEPG